jgi:hypothetical protein
MKAPAPAEQLSDYFAYVQAISPAALKVWTASNEAELAAAVDVVLEDALRQIKASGTPNVLGRARLLVQMLSAASIPCGMEEGHGGHVNVTVKHPAELELTVRRALEP